MGHNNENLTNLDLDASMHNYYMSRDNCRAEANDTNLASHHESSVARLEPKASQDRYQDNKALSVSAA